MRWRLYGGIALATILGLGATAYAFRKELVLLYVSQIQRHQIPIAENRPIVWQQGPATPDRPPTERPPNVVVIMVDDLGINDLTYFGGLGEGKLIATPNIDALARDGVVFRRAYSGTAACAPSRAMFMTGRYGTRTGFEFTPTPPGMSRIMDMIVNDGSNPLPLLRDAEADAALPPFRDQGLPGSEITLAEILKPAGYHTIHIGKWHLGNSDEFKPNAQGFDETVMMESGLYLPEDDPGVVNAKVPVDPIDRFLWAAMNYATSYNGGDWFAPKGYLTDFYTDEAVAAIKANRNRPFFLYLAHWGIHSPLQAAKEDYDALGHIADHRLRVYAAMLRALDRSVGRVTATLRELGLEENTIVVFTSDNGAPGYIGLQGLNDPYRGWKLTFFEGGIRVPLFVKWPARLTPGTVSEALASHLDLLPTIAAAANAGLPSDREIDGIDLLAAMGEAAPGTRTIFWRNGHYQAVQVGGWKLQIAARPDKAWLFDLTRDPTEQNNLAAENPAKVAELRALIDAHNKTQRAPLFPAGIDAPIMVDKTLGEPVDPAVDEYIYWSN